VLDLCYVATGRIDVVYAGLAGEGWKPWDHCAGALLVKEAGGVIEAIDQDKDKGFDLYSKSIICAVNQDLLEELREVIREEQK
jgi:fructose-1,6-bisphosphatase/inositol monophosphatase family enzyme